MNEAAAVAGVEALRGQDALARRASLDLARSFIVQAPAGSGKTELLIQRYLALLAHVDSPEEIVAITFTRKAAAEMRARVLEALAGGEAADPPAEPHRRVTWDLAREARARDVAAGWNLAESPNRLRVQTIDSLCHWLTLQLPLLSGFGAQPETVEDARELYLEAAHRTLAGLDGGNEWSGLVARVLRHLDNHLERAQALIADMLAVRDQWIRSMMDARGSSREALEAALANAVCDALAALVELVPHAARGEVVHLAAHAAQSLEALGKDGPLVACRGLTALPEATPSGLAAWRGIAELLLIQSGAVRQKVDVRTGFPPGRSKSEKEAAAAMKRRFDALAAAIEPHRTFVEQLHLARMLPSVSYSDAQWEAVEALAGLLPVAVAELEVLFRERGQVDFTAVAQAAVRALGEPDAPTDLALALDYRIRHLLVDEFQDTSWSQHDLLRRLTGGWQEGEGRTLFVVGDPVQSIYRFRKAEVALYMQSWHEGIGAVRLAPLRLSVNFRSNGALVEWFNRAFEQVLPDEEGLASGAVPFAPAVAAEAAARGDAPEFHALFTADREAEARLVVDLVRRARSENAGQTIAILVRARTHLSAIAPALNRGGLRFQAIEIESLAHQPVVQDLLGLTRALVHPADRVAWLSVLRAPWCGLTLADLDALAGNDHAAPVWTLMHDAAGLARLSADGRRRLARAREVLEAALARRRRAPLRRWIEGAWLALGGPACAEQPRDLEDAQVFLGLLEELEEGGDLPDLERLAARTQELYAGADAGAEAPLLQLMTIHKAKGLEFDTVIVPGLGYAPRHDDPKLLAWMERPRAGAGPDLLLAPIREAAQQQDAIYDYLRALEAVKEEHEAARLLYVAATRARSKLHLIGHVNPAPGKPLGPRPRSLLGHLWPAVEQEFAAAAHAQAQPVPAAASGARHGPTIRRFPAGWQLPAAPPALAWRPRAEIVYEAKSPHEEVEFSWASETAKHVGTVAHRFLQAIAAEGLDRWDAARIVALGAVLARDLARLGVPEPEIRNAVERVVRALHRSLTDERGRWVLGAHAQARSEFRLTGVAGGEVVNVAMDRTFVDERGTRWIVDYKTGVHEGGDVEGFLDRERERYRAQLEQYAALMRAMDNRPIRLGLYFPLLGGWREWAP
ncbi:MAG: DNA helicase UvrD [Betaproteobacteria bacterium]|nr:DNA helicase UvrD [Betaproteobacteria bacterium]